MVAPAYIGLEKWMQFKTVITFATIQIVITIIAI
jgi:hypothetical protein